jgi:hypothetical protein
MLFATFAPLVSLSYTYVMTIEDEEDMTCFMCKGSVQEGLSTFTADMGGCIVVIKDAIPR